MGLYPSVATPVNLAIQSRKNSVKFFMKIQRASGTFQRLNELGLGSNTNNSGGGIDPNTPVFAGGIDPNTPVFAGGIDPNTPVFAGGIDPNIVGGGEVNLGNPIIIVPAPGTFG